ncbi:MULTISPECIES: hypothetical protein [unclassified Paenibacillus]|uniref:hypothetical protein n=1 Tax=unclassified Paenibacillus TaxID=185978 RepID=UPI001AE6039F|nr:MULTISPECIES: hypothetical protein [unclassified Paenibacillus]MBP1154513.1 5'(3')-deoxyribonucleotidase [Paenibacillus sp. PvP091]MBP1170103.1 5'(3')-deoxyribonucleotidase [Paenibacillus sp. PvR098]MBP2441131.1 5'(3')-deoxyribonucleotidase [Paenibacillus sp. PvP052]
MSRSITDSVHNARVEVIASELEVLLGDSGKELVTRLTVMSKDELIELTDVLLDLQNYISAEKGGVNAVEENDKVSSNYGNILTTEEIEEMLTKLETETRFYI